jgi:putative SOS response-associated peptidase YedK
MCFTAAQTSSKQDLEKRFNATFVDGALYIPAVNNGFAFPETPIITNTQPDNIQLFRWGLVPKWAKDLSIRKNTLNARIETIDEKPAFKNTVNHRCLVLANAFYEWHWLDSKGKRKQKFELTLQDKAPFAFAGLWSEWVESESGEVMNTYTILTTPANELMSHIHNTKKRMPVILKRSYEKSWLAGSPLETDNHLIVAEAISPAEAPRLF